MTERDTRTNADGASLRSAKARGRRGRLGAALGDGLLAGVSLRLSGMPPQPDDESADLPTGPDGGAPVGRLSPRRLGYAASASLNEARAARKQVADNMARSARSRAAERAGGVRRRPELPIIGRLRAQGGGKILSGLTLVTKMNPVSMLLFRLVPWQSIPGGRAVRAAAEVGCGCATGCGCLSGCGCGCGCSGCAWPLLILFFVVALLSATVSSTPTFERPLFCKQYAYTTCSTAGVNLNIDLTEVPPQAIRDYQSQEKASGIPWFYALAWEKVATDYGRATLDGNVQVPGNALAATWAATAAQFPAANVVGADTAPISATDLATEQGRLTRDKQALIDHLASGLRGGSFGLMLVTSSEYTDFGPGCPDVWCDAWDRADSVDILGKHLNTVYQNVARAGPMSDPSNPTIDVVDAALSTYITDSVKTAANTGAIIAWQQIAGIGVAPGQPLPATWSGGPANGQAITNASRYLVCQLVSAPADIISGTCSQFATGGLTTYTFDPSTTLAAAIGSAYDPAKEVGQQVTDWNKLQALMGSVMADPAVWGNEKQAVYQVPLLGAGGFSTGQTAKVNAYVAAINTYAKSAYDAWSQAELAKVATGSAAGALSQSGANALFMWRPAIDAAVAQEKTLGYAIPWQYLTATIETDGAFGTDVTGVIRDCGWHDPTIDPALVDLNVGSKKWIIATNGNLYSATSGNLVGFGTKFGTFISPTNPSGVTGCWRFGQGVASFWTSIPNTEGVNHPEPAVAMNYCTYAFRHANGLGDNCGKAIITSTATGKSVTVNVIDFCDCFTGLTKATTPSKGGETERIVDLNDAAITGIGLTRAIFGTQPVSVQLLAPAHPVGWPSEVTKATPAIAALDVAQKLVTISNLPANPATPTKVLLTTLASTVWQPYANQDAWGCILGPTNPTFQVYDPLTDPDSKSPAAAPDCPYVKTAYTFARLYAGTSGGTITTVYGREPVSAFGYTWPLVGATMIDGEGPRPACWSNGVCAAQVAYYDPVTFRPLNLPINTSHDGLDLYPRKGCGSPVIADKAGSMQWYGNYAMVYHSDGLASMFGHMPWAQAPDGHHISGSERVSVKQGDVIGIVGNNGVSNTGPGWEPSSPGKTYPCAGGHLHYELYIWPIHFGSGLPGPSDTKYVWMWGNHPAIIHESLSSPFPGFNNMRFDPTMILPQDNAMLSPHAGGKYLWSSMAGWGDWYYRMYPKSDGWPTPLDLNAFRAHRIKISGGGVELPYTLP